MEYDFHMHSTASDGALTPGDLLELAVENGVTHLAITDHDTVAGYDSLECPEGLEIVPGIELSAVWNGRTIHIVGLNIDLASDTLREGIQLQNNARIKRAELIGARLSKLGSGNLFAEAMDAAEGAPGRPHFAQLLVQKGIVKDVKTAFKKYLGAGRPGDVKSEWATLDDIVAWIRAANGTAVIAHPAKYKMTNTKLACLVRDFKEAGGQGIEVVCGQQHPNVTQNLARLCEDAEMLASCGSDFHTPDNTWSSPGRFAALPKTLKPVWSSW